jgi:hypothetical protein
MNGRFDRRRLLDSHERAVAGLEKKLGVDERAQQRVAHRSVESPKTPCLSSREPQARHFEKLTLDPPEYFVDRSFLVGPHRLFTSRRSFRVDLVFERATHVPQTLSKGV